MSTIQNATQLPFAHQTVLEESLYLVKDHLRRFLDDPNFEAKVSLAFDHLDIAGVDKVRSLVKNLSESQVFPSIEILHEDILKEAQGAFASATETIYLSHSLFEQGNPIAISEVILEELGHYIDDQISLGDSHGDEGAIFSSLAQGKILDSNTIKSLKLETDSGYIDIDGQRIKIEKSDNTEYVTITGKVKVLIAGEEKELAHTKVGLRIKGNIVDIEDDYTFTDEFGNYTLKFSLLSPDDEEDIYFQVYSESPTFIFEAADGEPYTYDSKVYRSISQDQIINPVISNFDYDYHTLTIGSHFEEMVRAYDDFNGPIQKLRVIASDTTEYIESENLLKLSGASPRDKILAAFSNRIQNHHQLQSFNVGSGQKQIETATAWEKGLDVYFAIAAQQVYQSSPEESHLIFDDGDVRMNIEKHAWDVNQGESSFRSIAAILYDIADQNRDGRSGSRKDQISLNHVGLFQFLKSATSLTRLSDFWQLINSDRKVIGDRITKNEEKARFGAIFETAGVSPGLLSIKR